ncbi:polyprenyl synthetase family protein [Actinomadura sp. GTD37]|uniref:polyprenyl synthetase family protein n=1 Tax=Actinomadura sp. GTD37 TaxID=1778030 RepID=UPI0035C213A4
MTASVIERFRELVVDESDSCYFDRPLDHVPGMLLFSGLLELAARADGLRSRGRRPGRVVAGLDFTRFCELDRGTTLSCRPVPGRNRAWTVAARQAGREVPARLLAGLPVTAATRAALGEELSRCWLDAVDGQLRDLAARPAAATPESVLRSYEGRTGAPYAMAAAAAARLAGADPGRAARWRAFGRALGVLRQLVNDRRDLASGRHEDLANGTATYLLVQLLAALPAARRREALALHAAARHSASARAELTARMLDDEITGACAASVAPLIERAHAVLDLLGGEPGCVRELHALVDETAGRMPGSRLAVA